MTATQYFESYALFFRSTLLGIYQIYGLQAFRVFCVNARWVAPISPYSLVGWPRFFVWLG